MNSVDFRVRAWAGWTADCDEETVSSVPALLRRRVTPLGRQALSTVWGLPEKTSARLVFSSRHGEFSRTLSLLESIVAQTDVSPADFTLSVHHALAGLLSIAQGNHLGHTAVASGTESFCFGLLEAATCLLENPHEPVVLVHYEESLPEPYGAFNEPEENSIVLALALSSTAGEGEPFRLVMESATSHGISSASHALNFLSFLQGGAREGLSVDAHRQWRWLRNAVT